MAKGTRIGGRQKGTPNKRTVEKLREVEEQVAGVKKLRQKKATEALNELMQTSMGFAATYQRKIMAEPIPPMPDKDPEVHAANMARYKAALARFNQDFDRFWRAMEAAGQFAKALAPFQDPTFKAVMVSVAPEPTVKQIDGNVVQLNDPVALARVYNNMIKQVI